MMSNEQGSFDEPAVQGEAGVAFGDTVGQATATNESVAGGDTVVAPQTTVDEVLEPLTSDQELLTAVEEIRAVTVTTGYWIQGTIVLLACGFICYLICRPFINYFGR